MATTRIFPIHYNDFEKLITTIQRSTDYSANPEKTDEYNLITPHECLHENVHHVFTKTLDTYYLMKGTAPKVTDERTDILAYHLRQAFLPGEITPDKAHEVGYEMAMEVTKGKHPFIVCTHIDKAHLHNHIIFCAVQTDSLKKWHNPYYSHSTLIKRISDNLCKKHKLSVIENPKRGRSAYDPEKESGVKRKEPKRKTLTQFIDHIIENEKPKSFDEFLKTALENGAEIKSGRTISQTYSEWQKAKKAKNISLKIDGQINFVKLDRLKPEYTIEGIKKRIALLQEQVSEPIKALPSQKQPLKISTVQQAKQEEEQINRDPQIDERLQDLYVVEVTMADKPHELEIDDIDQEPTHKEDPELKTTTQKPTQKPKEQTPKPNEQTSTRFGSKPINRVNLIIDIENSIKAQQSAGYERWAEIFNLKQMAEALIILQQNNITTLDELTQTTNTAQEEQDKINEAITNINNRQKEINDLQRVIGTYNKTKNTFEKYKKSGYSNKFLEENRKAIDAYRQARKCFAELSQDEIPKIADLQNEYRTLASEKDNLYKTRSAQKTQSQEMQTIKTNIERWLDIRDLDESVSTYKEISTPQIDTEKHQKPVEPTKAKKPKDLEK